MPPDESRTPPLDTDTLLWVIRRLGEPDRPVSYSSTQSKLPMTPWMQRQIGMIQLNPSILPLSGEDVSMVAQWLRDVATSIEDGDWNSYLFPLERS